ncbi:MAG TPA: hypothetical protein PK198_04320 [Saprospiraceae bacterium]|jgi:hypothetical protein|nr:hypothetical protein [Saprospiraceae bacterium]HRK80573.1 hypothetical protein [Saprospiraceae bacterium]
MRSRPYLLPIFVCAALLYGGCTDDAPTRLSSDQLQLLDSLVTVQMPLVRQEEDSICKADFDKKLRRMVDSMLVIRREEEARLRQRMPKQ